jgi:epoxyqueuosine reductase
MINELKKAIEQKGYKIEVFSVDKLKLMQQDIIRQRNESDYNTRFKQRMYASSRIKKAPDYAKSVIVLAIPTYHAYIRYNFIRDGEKRTIFGLSGTPFGEAVHCVTDEVKKSGHTIETAAGLPQKRVAVQSGLAFYGKNNIVNVDGMGSFMLLETFYTSIQCDKDNWREAVAHPLCEGCTICAETCPTDSIREGRFMIDADLCMRSINSSERDFPEWLPEYAHHTLYGCLQCQGKCPINEGRQDICDVNFNEEETELILSLKIIKKPSEDFKERLAKLGYPLNKVRKRNLINLFTLMDKGHVPRLG